MRVGEASGLRVNDVEARSYHSVATSMSPPGGLVQVVARDRITGHRLDTRDTPRTRDCGQSRSVAASLGQRSGRYDLRFCGHAAGRRPATAVAAQDSGSCVRKDVGVQVPPRPLQKSWSGACRGLETPDLYRTFGVREVESGSEQGHRPPQSDASSISPSTSPGCWRRGPVSSSGSSSSTPSTSGAPPLARMHGSAAGRCVLATAAGVGRCTPCVSTPRTTSDGPGCRDRCCATCHRCCSTSRSGAVALEGRQLEP